MHVANPPLAWPLSCILNGCRLSTGQNKRDRERSGDRLEAPTKISAAPLPPTREICLSSLLPDDENSAVSEGARNTKMEQSQSMFMSRLPLEVRIMIYEEVLCRPVDVVHITTRKNGKLGYFRCKAEDGRCRGLECFHGPNDDLYSTWRTRDKDLFSTWSPSDTPDMEDGGLLALLQSCRQVYTEVISILYTQNTFSFTELPVFLDFASAVLPESLNSVQSLQFEYTLYRELCYMWPYLDPWGERREWMDTRRILSSVQELREVRVKVGIPANGFDESEHASELMKHLMVRTKARLLVEAIM